MPTPTTMLCVTGLCPHESCPHFVCIEFSGILEFFDRCLSLFSPKRCKGPRARELVFLLPLTSASAILGSQKTLKALAVTNNWYALTEPLPRRAVPPRSHFLHKGAGGMA